jgi:hypothetical protein
MSGSCLGDIIWIGRPRIEELRRVTILIDIGAFPRGHFGHAVEVDLKNSEGLLLHIYGGVSCSCPDQSP